MGEIIYNKALPGVYLSIADKVGAYLGRLESLGMKKCPKNGSNGGSRVYNRWKLGSKMKILVRTM